ncbi:MAG: sulfatase-like hydrolase/transferase, partial [Planctomycetota bacterium]|nr:sulfatase-like hydrolase/transferase [Planctomycetota bacterium]
VYHHMPGFNRVSDWHDYFQQQFDGHYQTLLHANQDVSNFNFPRGYPLNQLPSVKTLSRPPRNPREFDWGPLTKADLETGDGRMVGWFKQQLRTEHPRPFLMIAGIYRPHLPFYAPEAYFDRVAIQDVSLPPILDRDIQDLPPGGKALAAQRREDLKLVREQGKFQEMIHAYLASVTYADTLVGELLDALDSSDAADNTIIVFWSDHGWHFGEKEHLHKMTLWERATHIPFIVSVPNGDEAGTVCGAPVSLIDIFPTLTTLCHLPELKQLDGQNLSPLLAHTDREWPYPAITTHGYNNHSVRTARWRYIRYSDGGEELYDHHSDPNEWNNLAANPKFDPIKETLRRSIPETNQPSRSKKRHP